MIATGIQKPYSQETNTLVRACRYGNPQITTKVIRISEVGLLDYQPLHIIKYLEVQWNNEKYGWVNQFIHARDEDIRFRLLKSWLRWVEIYHIFCASDLDNQSDPSTDGGMWVNFCVTSWYFVCCASYWVLLHRFCHFWGLLMFGMTSSGFYSPHVWPIMLMWAWLNRTSFSIM